MGRSSLQATKYNQDSNTSQYIHTIPFTDTLPSPISPKIISYSLLIFFPFQGEWIDLKCELSYYQKLEASIQTMMDLVQQIESYSPQTNQPRPNAYVSDPSSGIAKAPLIDNSRQERMDADKPKEEEDTSCMRFFKQKFYEEYFKVTELDVLSRIKSAVVPPFKEDFLESIQPNPDFYGPFWIQTTLIFLLGTVGNFSNYIYSKFSGNEVFDGYFFELALVRYAFVLVYAYAAGIPVLLFFVLRFIGNPLPLPQLICAYGYANTCFVLAALLCIIPLTFLQWIFFLYAFANSTLFLVVCLRKHMEGNQAKLVPVLGLVAAAQFILFLCCKLIFVELK